MLPLPHRIAFLCFAAIAGTIGVWGFYRLSLRIRAGRPDPDLRGDHPWQRLWYAARTALTQQRTFKKRPVVSSFHAFIFYGFTFYMLVNLVDALEGFSDFTISSSSTAGAAYNLLADVLSLLVLVGVLALVARRFLLPSRRQFSFNARTLLHEHVKRDYITRDSVIVSLFILFHVGSRAIGAGAKRAELGPDAFQPFAMLLSHLFTTHHAVGWRVFGYWGALGSVLAFLMYFPYSKHIHIFMAPLKYAAARRETSGVLPAVTLDLDDEEIKIGAGRLEDLGWPRLLDAYACIQCNRCQDVCPASATGKSLSPAALEINKRMELNSLANVSGFFAISNFERGIASPRPLLEFALTPEAAWACTTCGACMEVCPVQDEQMLDIVDIRRQLVMIAGEFPAQLQSAFRGMERSKNPWGINHDRRLAWAEGLAVKTIEDNPTPEVLYWVGCAASYDPGAQATARAFVQLLDHAGVDFAVLGKQECCTGDSARRAGNEVLYRELADGNVATLNRVRPKLIVASCPHCLNSLGKEYKQIGGDYQVVHHTQYLQGLVEAKKLAPLRQEKSVAFHDPCYLGRHNGVYDAPRNLLRVLSNDVVELGRSRENSFCCGAGGAQFWKEEEPGDERISDNRFREVKEALSTHGGDKVLAVGCPFCKSMLGSTPGKADGDGIAVKDIAELMLESIAPRLPVAGGVAPMPTVEAHLQTPVVSAAVETLVAASLGEAAFPVETSAAQMPAAAPRSVAANASSERKKWQPKQAAPEPATAVFTSPQVTSETTPPPRKKWMPKTPAGSGGDGED